MTLSLETDVPAVQGDLSAWAEALRSVGKLVEQCERAEVNQTHSPPALVRLIADFERLRGLGRIWTQELRPRLVATIPGGIEDYSASFRGHSNAALSALDGADKALARARVQRELETLDGELDAHIGKVRAADSELKQLMLALGQAIRAIETDGKQAVSEVQLDEERMQRNLTELDQLLGEASSAKSRIDFFLSGEGTTGDQVLDVLTTINPGTWVARLGYKIWQLFGGSDPAEELRNRIAALRRERDSMSMEQRRVAGLRLIHRQITPLADSGHEAVRATGQIVNFWAVFEAKQDSVLAAIARSSAAELAPLCRMHLNTGARAWEQLATYARSLKVT